VEILVRVQHWVRDTDCRSIDDLRLLQGSSRANSCNVESGQVGLGACQFDGGAQSVFHPGLRHVPVDLRSVERILRRAENSPRSEHGEVGILHQQIEAQSLGDSIQFLNCNGSIRSAGLRSDATKVEELLICAHACQAGWGRRPARAVDRGRANAWQGNP